MNSDSEKMVAERVVPPKKAAPDNSKRNRTLGIIAAVLVAVAIIIAWTRGPQQPIAANAPAIPAPAKIVRPTALPLPVEAAPVSATTQAVIDQPPAPEPILAAPPPLALQQSDSQVLLAVADLAPQLAQWLIPSDQLRKWVLTVDLMADGKLPSRYRPVDYPLSPFQVEQQSARPIIPGQDSGQLSAVNYARLQPLVDVALAAEPEKLAQYYRQWLPLLEQAYQELGKKDSFDSRFQAALDKMLAAQPLAQNPRLIRPSVLYQYAEKNLEGADDIEKLLWRMGAANGERVQNFLLELRSHMDRD